MSPASKKQSVEAVEKDKAAALALYKVLKSLYDRFGNLSVHEILTFLEIQREPDQTQLYYVDRLNPLPRSTTQRNISLLTDTGHRNRAGLGLVMDKPSPVNWREKNYTLTAKGKNVIRDIQKHFDHYAATVL